MIIDIQNLTVKHNNFTALNKIDLQINKGEFIYLLGPNGAGKTTLVKTILKLIKPSSGSCKTNYWVAGFLPQKLSVSRDFPATVKEVIYSGLIKEKLIHSQTNKKHYEKLTAKLNIKHLEKKLISELSGGELQKVMFARALINKPDLLILDEPTSAIDIEFKKVINNIVKTLNKDKQVTVIIITHELIDNDEAIYSDRVIYIDKKIIFDDSLCNYTKHNLNKPKVHSHE